MDESAYALAKTVVQAVLELAESEQGAAIERLCAGDSTLRAEVEELLRFQGANLLDAPLPSPKDATTSATSPSRLIGRRIGSYELIAKLGEGGMGIVFEAMQEKPRRPVALKIMRGQILSERALRRFEFEIEILGQLVHPHIAQVYEAGIHEIDGEALPYFAMELVRGARPIDEHCRATRAPLRAKLELVLQAADALDLGHARGVVHRDVKPNNVLVDVDGRVKVIDFGVARATDFDLSRTVSGFVLEGTLAYMSPEQFSGDRGALGAQSDVHALGVLLYELACGRRPFDVDDLPVPGAIAVVREQEPVSPGRIDRALRGDFEAIVLKCLEKDPRRRYSSAGALATDLRRHLAGESVEARAPGPWRRGTRWITRHPWWSIGIGAGTLAAVAALALWIGYTTLARRPDHIERRWGVARLISKANLELATWEIGEDVTVAGLVPRGSARDAEKLFLLGVDSRSTATRWAGHVHLFDLDRPEQPFWSSSAWPLTMPESKPLRPGVHFSPIIVLVKDVFSDAPGAEIVVVHREVPFSACAIRIYDLSGGLRYEAWHEGTIGSLVWLDGPRLLVFAAVEGEGTWHERGVGLADGGGIYPTILAALRVRDGRTHVDRFMVGDGIRRDDTLAWLRWIGPVEAIVTMGKHVSRVEARGEPGGGEHVLWSIQATPDAQKLPVPSFFVQIASDGSELSRYATDEYRQLRDAARLPDLSDFRLSDYEELPRVSDGR